MKNKSLFLQILLLVTLAFLCVALTVTVALLAGSIETSIFDLKNLNFANMIPVFIFGGMITSFVIIVTLLFTSRTLFYKIRDFLNTDKSNNDK